MACWAKAMWAQLFLPQAAALPIAIPTGPGPDRFLSSLSSAGTDPEGCGWHCFGQCLWPLHRPVGQVSRASLGGPTLPPWV